MTAQQKLDLIKEHALTQIPGCKELIPTLDGEDRGLVRGELNIWEMVLRCIDES